MHLVCDRPPVRCHDQFLQARLINKMPDDGVFGQRKYPCRQDRPTRQRQHAVLPPGAAILECRIADIDRRGVGVIVVGQKFGQPRHFYGLPYEVRRRDHKCRLKTAQ